MSKPFKHLSAGFLRAMEEIGELGYAKHGENSFQHMILTGNIKRKIARHSTTEILRHAQQHQEEYRLHIPHDYFNDLLHQLAAAAFNCMVECQFAGITNEPPAPVNYQQRVTDWGTFTFGADAKDQSERTYRFTEESLELGQATGLTREQAHELVDYVYDRPVGHVVQEIGGVMTTVALLASAFHVDMEDAAEMELKRVWANVDKIRAKHLSKPRNSPLPGPSSHDLDYGGDGYGGSIHAPISKT